MPAADLYGPQDVVALALVFVILAWGLWRGCRGVPAGGGCGNCPVQKLAAPPGNAPGSERRP